MANKQSLFIIGFAVLVVGGVHPGFGQKDRILQRSKNNAVLESSAKRNLLTAIERSKKEQVISKRIQISVQGKQINSLFEHAKPDRFRLFESIPGQEARESVEIGGQRYMNFKGQWVKVRKDFYPLREQFFDLFFPTQLASKPGDLFKIKTVLVTFGGPTERNGTHYERYNYAITYSGIDSDEEGVVWIDQATGLVQIVETNGVGLAGRFTAQWTYEYGKNVTIDAPQSFIEKDWVN